MEFTVCFGCPALPLGAVSLSQTLHSEDFQLRERRIRVLYQENSQSILLVKEEYSPRRYRVCLERSCAALWDNNLVLKMLDLPELMLQSNAVFLHASFVEHEGKAILFTAPKQTGKSTQAALWKKHRKARIINGDRALLRCMQGIWTAFGSPYCGTSQICENASHPIAAVVLLEQGKENRIRPAMAREAAAAFLDGCTFDPERQTEQVLDLALEIWGKLPVFHFACLPDESAVDCLEKALDT